MPPTFFKGKEVKINEIEKKFLKEYIERDYPYEAKEKCEIKRAKLETIVFESFGFKYYCLGRYMCDILKEVIKVFKIKEIIEVTKKMLEKRDSGK